MRRENNEQLIDIKSELIKSYQEAGNEEFKTKIEKYIEKLSRSTNKEDFLNKYDELIAKIKSINEKTRLSQNNFEKQSKTINELKSEIVKFSLKNQDILESICIGLILYRKINIDGIYTRNKENKKF